MMNKSSKVQGGKRIQLLNGKQWLDLLKEWKRNIREREVKSDADILGLENWIWKTNCTAGLEVFLLLHNGSGHRGILII